MLSYHRDRAACAWCISFGQKWKTGTGRNILSKLGIYTSIFNHSDIIGVQSYRIQRKKRKLRRRNTPHWEFVDYVPDPEGYYAIHGH